MDSMLLSLLVITIVIFCFGIAGFAEMYREQGRFAEKRKKTTANSEV
jgi:hypothetical protein